MVSLTNLESQERPLVGKKDEIIFKHASESLDYSVSIYSFSQSAYEVPNWIKAYDGPWYCFLYFDLQF